MRSIHSLAGKENVSLILLFALLLLSILFIVPAALSQEEAALKDFQEVDDKADVISQSTQAKLEEEIHTEVRGRGIFVKFLSREPGPELNTRKKRALFMERQVRKVRSLSKAVNGKCVGVVLYIKKEAIVVGTNCGLRGIVDDERVREPQENGNYDQMALNAVTLLQEAIANQKVPKECGKLERWSTEINKCVRTSYDFTITVEDMAPIESGSLKLKCNETELVIEPKKITKDKKLHFALAPHQIDILKQAGCQLEETLH